MSWACLIWLIMCSPWAKPQTTWHDVIEADFQIYFTFQKRPPWQALLSWVGIYTASKYPQNWRETFVQSNDKRFLQDFTLLSIYGDRPRNESCLSDSSLFPKWHMVSLTESVIWLSVTGLLRKLNCDFPCFHAIRNLTVNLLIYFPYKTFICSLWTVDFISFRLASLGN